MKASSVARISALVLAGAFAASLIPASADPTASAAFAASDEKAASANKQQKSAASIQSELDSLISGTSAADGKPPKAAEDATQKIPKGLPPDATITGAAGYLMGTPRMDVDSLRKPDLDKTLKGAVSAEGTTHGANGKLLLPEMDCVGFAAQTSINGSAALKGMVANGKAGYHTDGASWLISGDYPVIASVFDGDSCQAQGIESGDIIVELNGVNCYKLDHDSILSLFRSCDANMRNHYTLKRGNQLFRVVTQITWHPFGSGSYEENLWKSTWSKFKY
ncbi:MAG TPA: hypothetical protein V6D22_12445 [Candidatus Obscuribacterales bacterium]